MIQTTYTNARANFASLCRRATEERQTVVISRRGGDDVVLIAADELRGLLETAHLLRSPKNAKRLLEALNRAKEAAGSTSSLEFLRKEIGIEEEKKPH